jgi:3-hydroxymyristoyl/3-hydroxydecanoyl-(acyl carrier protein) dehydratase
MFELITSARFEPANARGYARVPADIPLLADHFPGAPTLPGSLQLELAAQIAGPLAEQAVAAHHGLDRWAFLGMVRRATFISPVALPAELEIVASLERVEPSSVLVAARIERAGTVTCRAELVMVLEDARAEWAAAIAQARARVSAWRRA